jgi:carbamoyl-phosphate synthase large subunit
VIIAFGGQTPLKLAKSLEAQGVPILGTSPDNIDVAEDRKRFGSLLQKLHIPHPAGGTVGTPAEALKVAEKIGYPVLVRPSYVLGGRAMEIVYNDESLESYMKKAVDASPDHPVLIDKFLEDAREFDVDAVCDGTDVLIGGVLHHIQEAGIHSGDSTSVLTPRAESPQVVEQLKDFTRKLARALKVKGLINVQYAEKGGIVYVLEVNPRASRTVPFISKAMGIPLAKIAAKVMVGKKLKDLGYDLEAPPKYIAVKEPVFPFNKFPQTQIFLGPEMRSTGEVMSMSASYGEAIAKAVLAAGGILPVTGGIFLSVNNNDKDYELIEAARGFLEFGFRVYATRGTSLFLDGAGVANTMIYKANEGRPNVVDYIKNGDIQIVVNTPFGQVSRFDERAIGKAALEEGRLVITSISGAAAGLEAVKWYRSEKGDVRSLQEYHAKIPDAKK